MFEKVIPDIISEFGENLKTELGFSSNQYQNKCITILIQNSKKSHSLRKVI